MLLESADLRIVREAMKEVKPSQSSVAARACSKESRKMRSVIDDGWTYCLRCHVETPCQCCGYRVSLESWSIGMETDMFLLWRLVHKRPPERSIEGLSSVEEVVAVAFSLVTPNQHRCLSQ